MAEQKKEVSTSQYLLRNLGALVVAVLIIVIGVAIGSNSGSETATGEEGATTEETTTTVEYIGDSNLTQNGLEVACQDANLGVTDDGRTVVRILDYNFSATTYGNYDADGNPIVIVMWNGKDADDETLRFTCYASGPDDDNITVYYITAGGEDIYGSTTFLDSNSYTADGRAQY